MRYNTPAHSPPPASPQPEAPAACWACPPASSVQLPVLSTRHRLKQACMGSCPAPSSMRWCAPFLLNRLRSAVFMPCGGTGSGVAGRGGRQGGSGHYAAAYTTEAAADIIMPGACKRLQASYQLCNAAPPPQQRAPRCCWGASAPPSCSALPLLLLLAAAAGVAGAAQLGHQRHPASHQQEGRWCDPAAPLAAAERGTLGRVPHATAAQATSGAAHALNPSH